jgi:hypothetical protein
MAETAGLSETDVDIRIITACKHGSALDDFAFPRERPICAHAQNDYPATDQYEILHIYYVSKINKRAKNG